MENIFKPSTYINKTVYLYFPTTKYNSNYGSLHIQKEVFDDLLKKFLKEYGKYTKTSEIIFQITNLTYKIVNKKDRYLIETVPITTIDTNNCIINIVTENKLNYDSFPIINKYNNVCKKNKMIFTNENISISLITETYDSNNTNECCYYVEITFTNTDINYHNVDKIVSYVNENIF